MTLHHGHRRHEAPLKEQEIPTSDCNSSSELTLRVGTLLIPRVSHSEPSASVITKTLRHIQILPEVLPAPFKLHKPPPPCRLPSSRCI